MNVILKSYSVFYIKNLGDIILFSSQVNAHEPDICVIVVGQCLTQQ